MKQEFYDAYETLYNEFIFENQFKPERKLPDEYCLLRIIRKVINENPSAKSIRPDAKYFLIVNFHYLIIKPLHKQRPLYKQRPRVLLEEMYPTLEEDIRSDISTIILNAEKESNEDEISGHIVMRVIDKLWKELKTTRFEIWG